MQAQCMMFYPLETSSSSFVSICAGPVICASAQVVVLFCTALLCATAPVLTNTSLAFQRLPRSVVDTWFFWSSLSISLCCIHGYLAAILYCLSTPHPVALSFVALELSMQRLALPTPLFQQKYFQARPLRTVNFPTGFAAQEPSNILELNEIQIGQ